MNEYLVKDHLSDLRRDALAHPRAYARKDRAVPAVTARVSARLHRRPAVVGCEA